jgi:hypothetical protein
LLLELPNAPPDDKANARYQFQQRVEEKSMKLLSRFYLRVRSVLLLALLAGMAVSINGVRVDVPGAPPTFTNPLNIDNAFFPFQPGGLKVYGGKDHGTKTASIDK